MQNYTKSWIYCAKIMLMTVRATCPSSLSCTANVSVGWPQIFFISMFQRLNLYRLIWPDPVNLNPWISVISLHFKTTMKNLGVKMMM